VFAPSWHATSPLATNLSGFASAPVTIGWLYSSTGLPPISVRQKFILILQALDLQLDQSLPLIKVFAFF
jgi:hypothetical protein